MIIQPHENLKNAITSLATEEKLLTDQIADLQAKLVTIRAALSPLRQLVGPSVVMEVELSQQAPLTKHTSEDVATATTLREAITAYLLQNGPSSRREIARGLLNSGYQTQSGDFPNVIGSTLRRLKDTFQTNDDGRWTVIA